jgi:hypothetical protein
VSRPAASRRELLGGILAGAAASTVLASSAGAAGAVGGDDKLLATLLAVERRLSSTYHRVLASGQLGVIVAAEVSGFQRQEQQHIGALEQVIALRGGSVPPTARFEPGGPAETQSDALDLLLGAERMAESAYFGALSKLEDPALVALAAEIMASEAQHWTLLRALRDPGNLAGSVPSAFVTGSP